MLGTRFQISRGQGIWSKSVSFNVGMNGKKSFYNYAKNIGSNLIKYSV